MLFVLKRVVLSILSFCLISLVLIVILLNYTWFDYSKRPPESQIALVWGPGRDFDSVRYVIHRNRHDLAILDQNASPNSSRASSISVPAPRFNDCRTAFDRILYDINGKYFINTYLESTDLIYNETLGVYAYQGWRVVIWSFWDAAEMPNYIRLSILTWLCHNDDAGYFVAVINTETAETLLGSFHPAFPYLKIAHKADYLRAHLLNTFGGVWLDADTLAMASAGGQIDFLSEGSLLHNASDFVGYTWEPQATQIGFGVIGPVKAKNVLSKDWVSELTRKLDDKMPLIQKEKKDPFAWTEILGDIVMPLHASFLENAEVASRLNFQYTAVPGPWTYGQLVVLAMDQRYYPLFGAAFCPTSDLPGGRYSNQKYPYPAFNVTPYLMYHNSMMPKDSPLRPLTVADFLKAKTIFGKLVFESLKRCVSKRGRTYVCPYAQVVDFMDTVYAQC